MHRVVIGVWLGAATVGVVQSGRDLALLLLLGAAGAWSLSLVQRWFGEN